MEFRVLGPVEVWDGGQRLVLGGLRPRTLLAVLRPSASAIWATCTASRAGWARP
jgi:hypothetical protein